MPRGNDEDDEYYDDRFDDRPRARAVTSRATVQRMVAGPAKGLIWTGVIGAFLFLVGGAVAIYLGLEHRNDPDPEVEETAIMAIIIAAVFMVLGIPYYLFMAYAAMRFKALAGPGWGQTANILGLVTVVLFGLCLPTTWAAAGCGIWGLVVLNKPQVQRYFRNQRKTRDFDNPERDDEWER
jgi:O-antigen/teichoic acid export membrane protein